MGKCTRYHLSYPTGKEETRWIHCFPCVCSIYVCFIYIYCSKRMPQQQRCNEVILHQYRWPHKPTVELQMVTCFWQRCSKENNITFKYVQHLYSRSKIRRTPTFACVTRRSWRCSNIVIYHPGCKLGGTMLIHVASRHSIIKLNEIIYVYIYIS